MISHKEYKIDAIKYHSAVNLIKYVSIDTYNRIGFVHQNKDYGKLRIGEVTLTENLVYELHKFADENTLHLVKIYESVNEDTNGSDLLLDFPIGNYYIRIPIQAKKVTPDADSKDGSYISFHHGNSKGIQGDLLTKYAEKLGSYLPLYLLYNFTSNCKTIKGLNEKEEYYGCSVLNLNNVGSLEKTVKFSHLHPSMAIPFYKLFQNFNRDDEGDVQKKPEGPSPVTEPIVTDNDVIRKCYKLFGIDATDDFIQKLNLKKKEDVFADIDNWIKPFMNTMKNSGNNNQTQFNPRYRIVVLTEPIVPTSDEGVNAINDGDAAEMENNTSIEELQNEPEIEEKELYEIYCLNSL
ncbi:hypothetical protein H1R17_10925 [Flavobacterium sp. xlx-214]|uniref:DUF6615 family protein n=1 Tax=unclassified Flavobacterium TaxID=196869 RepID=UPI0013D514DA|nr:MULTISPECIES: DUF6615 family protein [unclassified Flavobacterium]MBA5791726.1 hypothetical protein [Flavobacterium sp. xlx-221]QMI82965.1 hypothetical protein H1R17_10925 [Flavobacterium sp. xlx-214]